VEKDGQVAGIQGYLYNNEKKEWEKSRNWYHERTILLDLAPFSRKARKGKNAKTRIPTGREKKNSVRESLKVTNFATRI
jgi:hypothetical protein